MSCQLVDKVQDFDFKKYNITREMPKKPTPKQTKTQIKTKKTVKLMD